MKAFISHISEYFPEKIYSNDDFFKEFPHLKKNEATLNKIGVKNRHIVDPDKTALDLAVEAARQLFKEHPIRPDEIEFVIFCSLEFDYTLPSTAAVFQRELQLPHSVGAIDLVSSCTGFIHALSVAKGMVESNGINNVLLLFPSTLTKEFHPKDYNSKFIFGDGATAVLMGSRNEPGVGEFVFGTDGSRSDYIIIQDGRGRNPINDDSFKEIRNDYGNITCRANFFMDGTGVFLFGIKTIPLLIDDILKKNNMNKDDVDYFVFHQANAFLLETIRKKADIPEEKFIIHLEHTGNTVASTIPLAMNKLLRDGKLKPGNSVLFAAFGTGLTWGGTIVKF
ncbi:MAG: ketoacyl-ACP synthase III [Flavobacteriales bacterium]|nr:ketoacyl-ACP synthase III [Flavobacteriales bacterium]